MTLHASPNAPADAPERAALDRAQRPTADRLPRLVRAGSAPTIGRRARITTALEIVPGQTLSLCEIARMPPGDARHGPDGAVADNDRSGDRPVEPVSLEAGRAA